MITILKEIIEKEVQAIRRIPVSDAYDRAIDLIFSQIHKKNGKLICSGMGKAGQVASNIATTFSSTGTPACFLHPSNAQHGDLGILRENDLMLLISNSGKLGKL
jgi:arabinose-5-phosphate isomerase